MITLIAAVAKNGVMGAKGTLPWHLPADLQRFKQLTLGGTVLMGRKTFESLPAKFRPLPGRRNVVLTRQVGWRHEGVKVVGSLDEALRLVGDEVLWVAGGAEIYALALPLAQRLELTEIEAEVAGDTFFPAWNRAQWREVGREMKDEQGMRYGWVTYEKI